MPSADDELLLMGGTGKILLGQYMLAHHSNAPCTLRALPVVQVRVGDHLNQGGRGLGQQCAAESPCRFKACVLPMLLGALTFLGCLNIADARARWPYEEPATSSW